LRILLLVVLHQEMLDDECFLTYLDLSFVSGGGLFVEGLKLCFSEFGGNDRIWASHPWSRIRVLHGKVMFQ
jgi:hypothetical protein